jgi:hypothetical protein
MQVLTVDEAEIALWRVERLQAAIDHLSEGNKSSFARTLGYADGAFIRQMLAGSRAISEKITRKIEAQPGMAGWFNPIAYRARPLEVQIRNEIDNRDVPDHVLASILELVRGFPEKARRAA